MASTYVPLPYHLLHVYHAQTVHRYTGRQNAHSYKIEKKFTKMGKIKEECWGEWCLTSRPPRKPRSLYFYYMSNISNADRL